MMQSQSCFCPCHTAVCLPLGMGKCYCTCNWTSHPLTVSSNPRLSELEKKVKGHEDRLDKQFEMIFELQKKVKKLEQWQDSSTQTPNKRPYKCPVCDGEGSIKKSLNDKLAEFERLPTVLAIMCSACKGKGIVWD